MLVYKIDILKELKLAGYNTNRIRKEKLISESSLQNIRRGVMVRPDTLDALCRLLEVQPGQVIRYYSDIDYDNRLNAGQLAPYEINKEYVEQKENSK